MKMREIISIFLIGSPMIFGFLIGNSKLVVVAILVSILYHAWLFDRELDEARKDPLTSEEWNMVSNVQAFRDGFSDINLFELEQLVNFMFNLRVSRHHDELSKSIKQISFYYRRILITGEGKIIGLPWLFTKQFRGLFHKTNNILREGSEFFRKKNLFLYNREI